MPRREEHSDDEPRPKLQSLAQAARTNQLKQIRGTLLAVGIIIIIWHVIDLVSLPGQVRAAMAKGAMPAANAPGAANPETLAYALGIGIDGGAIVVGLLFILFGVLVSYYPVPITIAALIVYTLMTIACLPIMILGLGVQSVVVIVVRIMFIIALAKAVMTAFAYQREQREQLAAVEEWEDDDA